MYKNEYKKKKKTRLKSTKEKQQLYKKTRYKINEFCFYSV